MQSMEVNILKATIHHSLFIQNFLEWRHFAQWKLNWIGWDFEVEPWKDSFKERGISKAWRSGEKTLDIWANCVLKHCLSLKTFIPNFVAFFVSLGIVISCIHKMSFSVTLAKREFMGHCFIIHLPGGGHCSLVEDSKLIWLLEIPTSPSLHIYANCSN